MSYTPPIFIRDPSTSKLIEIVIHNETVEIQMRRRRELQEALNDFRNVDLHALFIEQDENAIRGVSKGELAHLESAMRYFDRSLSVRAFELSTDHLFILLAATCFWGDDPAEEVKQELFTRIMYVEGEQLTHKNFKIFFHYFPWKDLAPIDKQVLSQKIQKVLFHSQYFHIYLNDSKTSLQFLPLKVLYAFIEEGLYQEIKSEVEELVLKKVKEESVSYTGGINSTNYKFFMKHILDEALVSKIRLECFLSEECRSNWQVLQNHDLLERVLSKALTFSSSTTERDLVEGSRSQSKMSWLASATFNRRDLEMKIVYILKKLNQGFGHIYLIKVERLNYVDKLLKAFDKDIQHNISESQLNIIAYLKALFQRTHVGEGGFECFGKGLARESKMELAKKLVFTEMIFEDVDSELQIECEFYKNSTKLLEELIDQNKNLNDKSIESVIKFLISFCTDYPAKCLHDPALNGYLQDPKENRTFVVILCLSPQYKPTAKRIFNIDFNKF